MLFGGSALITLAYIAAFAASLEAFGGGPSIVVLGAPTLVAWEASRGLRSPV